MSPIARLAELNDSRRRPNLWNDAAAAQKLMRERNHSAHAMDGVHELEREVADTSELIGLAEADNDDAMAAEGLASLRTLADEAKRREIEIAAVG